MSEQQYKPLPDWSDAPKWANWRAIDKSGELWYYKSKPVFDHSTFIGTSLPLEYFGDGYDPANWQTSLEARPEKTTPKTLQD